MRPDRHIIGSNIAYLRKRQRQSVTTFAQNIGQPVWMIMLLEDCATEQSAELVDLLPNSSIDSMLTTISQTYGISYQWLTTPHPELENHPRQNSNYRPEKFYLPIALTPVDVVVHLDGFMQLALSQPAVLDQNYDFIQHHMRTIIMLFRLQLSCMEQHNRSVAAEQTRQRLRRLLKHRFERWKRELEQLQNGSTPFPE